MRERTIIGIIFFSVLCMGIMVVYCLNIELWIQLLLVGILIAGYHIILIIADKQEKDEEEAFMPKRENKTMAEEEESPQGLKPRYILEEERLEDIKQAIQRYTERNLEVPNEWLKEYNELIERRNKLC